MLTHREAICVYVNNFLSLFLCFPCPWAWWNNIIFVAPVYLALRRKRPYPRMPLHFSWTHVWPGNLWYNLSWKPLQVKSLLGLILRSQESRWGSRLCLLTTTSNFQLPSFPDPCVCPHTLGGPHLCPSHRPCLLHPNHPTSSFPLSSHLNPPLPTCWS